MMLYALRVVLWWALEAYLRVFPEKDDAAISTAAGALDCPASKPRVDVWPRCNAPGGSA